MQSFCIGAVKGKYARFPQTAPTDVSRKSVDGSQGKRWSGRPAKGNEENGVLCLSVIHVAFQRPLDLGTRGGFMTLHLAGSGQLVHGAGRRCEGFIPRIRGGHLCTMRC
uniref:Uncharacterized protein n=1 Tax=Fagus sylvatica TaxID=28930 RepID=A0A2N9EXL3_FAGSY